MKHRINTDSTNDWRESWFPGSAWEPAAFEALPRESLRRRIGPEREAEPGNEQIRLLSVFYPCSIRVSSVAKSSVAPSPALAATGTAA
jgi:hypothetical protein